MKYVFVKDGRAAASRWYDSLVAQDTPAHKDFFQSYLPSHPLIGLVHTPTTLSSPFSIAHNNNGKSETHTYNLNINHLLELVDQHLVIYWAAFNIDNNLITKELYKFGPVIISQGKFLHPITQTELLFDSPPVITCLFSIVKIGNTPGYLMLLNSDLVATTGGFDYDDVTNGISWQLITRTESTLKDWIFPISLKGGEMVGNGIITRTLSSNLYFSFEHSPIAATDLRAFISAILVDSLDYNIHNDGLSIKLPHSSRPYAISLRLSLPSANPIASRAWAEHDNFTWKFLVI